MENKVQLCSTNLEKLRRSKVHIFKTSMRRLVYNIKLIPTYILYYVWLPVFFLNQNSQMNFLPNGIFTENPKTRNLFSESKFLSGIFHESPKTETFFPKHLLPE